MPALVHLLCHYLLGAQAAWLARRAPSLRQHLLGWPLALAYLLAGVLLVPAATFQCRMYPSHAVGYSLSPELHPALYGAVGPLSFAAVVLNLAALLLGFVVMRQGCLSGRSWMRRIPVGLALALSAAYLWQLGDRAWQFGTYQAFWGHEALSFWHTPSAWAVVLAYTLCSLFLAQLSARVGDSPLQWP